MLNLLLSMLKNCLDLPTLILMQISHFDRTALYPVKNVSSQLKLLRTGQKKQNVLSFFFYWYKCSKKKFVLWRKNPNKAYVIFVFSFIYLGKKDTTWGETLCGLSPHWICTNGRKENTFGGNSKQSFTDPDHPNHPIRIGRTRGKFLKGGFVLLLFMGLITGLPCWTFC